MRNWALVCLAALGVGCGSDTSQIEPTISTVARVEFQDVEGGVWLIRSDDDGRLYRPSTLPDNFKVVGGRVAVTMTERRGLAGASLPGIPVAILTIKEFDCSGVFCGVPEPAVTLHIVNSATSAAVEGVVITNVIVPEPPPTGEARGGLIVGCSPSFAREKTTCTVEAGAPGTYILDVTAPGYQTRHVVIEVPAYRHVLGGCCEPPWVAQTVEVTLAQIN